MPKAGRGTGDGGGDACPTRSGERGTRGPATATACKGSRPARWGKPHTTTFNKAGGGLDAEPSRMGKLR